MVKKTELRPYTIPGTGKVVKVKQSISMAMLVLDLANDPTNPKPLPPIQEVVIAGKKLAERNYSSPAYAAAVATWEQGIEATASMLMLETALVIDLSEADKKEVAELRENRPGLPLNQTDAMIWLKYVAIGSDDDFKSLLQFIRGNSEPTEEEIGKAADGFQGNA